MISLKIIKWSTYAFILYLSHVRTLELLQRNITVAISKLQIKLE